MNALSDIQNIVHSIDCITRADQISVAHLAILRLSSVLARLHGTLLIP
ncbi:hypothetical protein AD44_0816 [Escherichia coli 3-373-03_S4_C3]|nr:hypothetical protein HMPREF9543_01441 [Escherichia coli MS 146-1]EGW92721.1 hypothetical protein ECSTECEH250_3790 [Escherichia coli STEC_EH250]ENA50454.1 hypothetical protein EC2726950_3513 [Escherichia coli 2726950]ESD49062.1 hypothetical protein HMPREF1605_04103 [Escherichia coli 908521]EYE33851.1 hypothetical protein AB10_3644 [Escherichia coli 1-110-08_S1_C1]KDA78256.1 hypothetical protein AC13_3421 [Escherichia coli 2-011-08_S3_C2]KDU32615.1 hypothetical protein AD17_0667 [Escherichia